MATWQTLDVTHHRQAGWQPFHHYGFAAHHTQAPVLAPELGHAVAYYPLAWHWAAQQPPRLVALLSLLPGVNFYMNGTGQWQAPYVPAYFRGYPFRLSPENPSALQIDTSSERLHTPAQPEDERFYQDSGAPSERVTQLLAFLQQCQQQQAHTDQLSEQLAAAGVLAQWRIQMRRGEHAQPLSTVGLYHIDPQALKQLAGDALAPLAASGALALAYAQQLSEARLHDFKSRYAAYQQRVAAEANAHKLGDDVFGDDDEELQFDF